jgi:fido (protein-threonine AMPylation protein)
MPTTKEQFRKDNYLCTLQNGREVFKGDSVYRIELKIYVTADSIFVDRNENRYLCFEEGGNAWIDGPYNFGQMLR